MNNKVIYRSLCETHKEIPLFMQAWWLDAASKENWDVIFAKIHDEIVGFFVFSFQKKLCKKQLSLKSHKLDKFVNRNSVILH